MAQRRDRAGGGADVGQGLRQRRQLVRVLRRGQAQRGAVGVDGDQPLAQLEVREHDPQLVGGRGLAVADPQQAQHRLDVALHGRAEVAAGAAAVLEEVQVGDERVHRPLGQRARGAHRRVAAAVVDGGQRLRGGLHEAVELRPAPAVHEVPEQVPDPRLGVGAEHCVSERCTHCAIAVTAARRSASSSPRTSAISSTPGALGAAAVAHSCATSSASGNAARSGSCCAARARRAGVDVASRPRSRCRSAGASAGSASTTRSATAAGSAPRTAASAAASAAVTMHPPAVVHQRRDGGGHLGGVDVVQDQERVVADRRDHASRARPRGAAAAGAARRHRRPPGPSARRRRPGGAAPRADGPPDLLVRTRRRPVRCPPHRGGRRRPEGSRRRSRPVRCPASGHLRPSPPHGRRSPFVSPGRQNVASLDRRIVQRSGAERPLRATLGLAQSIHVPTEHGVAMRRDNVSHSRASGADGRPHPARAVGPVGPAQLAPPPPSAAGAATGRRSRGPRRRGSRPAPWRRRPRPPAGRAARGERPRRRSG